MCELSGPVGTQCVGYLGLLELNVWGVSGPVETQCVGYLILWELNVSGI